MVEVTQADRDAAEKLAIGHPYTCFNCKDELTFAFAAHRLAAETGIVAWLRTMSDCLNNNNAQTAPRCMRCPGCGRHYAADAIARREHAGDE